MKKTYTFALVEFHYTKEKEGVYVFNGDAFLDGQRVSIIPAKQVLEIVGCPSKEIVRNYPYCNLTI